MGPKLDQFTLAEVQAKTVKVWGNRNYQTENSGQETQKRFSTRSLDLVTTLDVCRKLIGVYQSSLILVVGKISSEEVIQANRCDAAETGEECSAVTVCNIVFIRRSDRLQVAKVEHSSAVVTGVVAR